MPKIVMLATSVNVSPGRAAVTLVAQPDPNDEGVAHGSINLIVPLEDDEDIDFVAGQTYSVSFNEARAPRGSALAAHAEAHANVTQAARISNSTNDPNYVTPASQKLPPPVLPDGVVTEPRPSVVMEPVTDVPATAGVVTPGPASVEDAPKVGENAPGAAPGAAGGGGGAAKK